MIAEDSRIYVGKVVAAEFREQARREERTVAAVARRALEALREKQGEPDIPADERATLIEELRRSVPSGYSDPVGRSQ